MKNDVIRGAFIVALGVFATGLIYRFGGNLPVIRESKGGFAGLL